MKPDGMRLMGLAEEIGMTLIESHIALDRRFSLAYGTCLESEPRLISDAL